MNWQIQFTLLMLMNIFIALAGWIMIGSIFPIMWGGAAFGFGAMWHIYLVTKNLEDFNLQKKEDK